MPKAKLNPPSDSMRDAILVTRASGQFGPSNPYYNAALQGLGAAFPVYYEAYGPLGQFYVPPAKKSAGTGAFLFNRSQQITAIGGMPPESFAAVKPWLRSIGYNVA